MFHTAYDFQAAKKKIKHSLGDCTLADIDAKVKFDKYDNYLTEKLINKVENQKKEFLLKNSYKDMSDHWKENLIRYFDSGDDAFKDLLFKKHKKRGLKTSSEFEAFFERLNRKQEQKRAERAIAKETKSNEKNRKKGEGEKKIVSSGEREIKESLETAAVEQGENKKFVMNFL